MAFEVKSGKLLTTNDGIPYMWESYNTDGATSVTEISTSLSSDRFGSSVAVGTSKIVVGARLADPNGSNSGSVCIYNLDGSGKIEIDPSDGMANAHFGSSVAIDEKSGKIVVGADGHTGGGQAYIYNLDGTGEVILAPSELQDLNGPDTFGSIVGIQNNKVYVAAERYSQVNEDEGAMFMFNTDGTNKKFVISPVGLTSYGKFGDSFEVGCDRVVVGQTGVGTAYYKFHIFDLHMNHIKTFESDSNGASQAGNTKWLAVGSGRIVVGDYLNNTHSGSVHIHDLDGNFIKSINSPRAAPGEVSGYFGFSVAVDCGKIIVSSQETSGGGNYIYIFDLDGNFISEINEGSPYDRLGLEYGLTYRNGRLLLSHEDQNKVFVYNLPPMYTPFDVRDLEKGNK